MKKIIILLSISLPLMGWTQIQDSTKVDSIQEVVLTKKNPITKRKIDRMEFNVEHSNLASLNAWEILKKTPGITAVGNHLSIKGNQNIIVTINDKKIMMTADELRNYLENTPGSEMQTVEVISNPPAKYEASGSAIINIKMKNIKKKGYRGSVYTGYTQATYAKGNVGTRHEFKKNRWTLSTGFNSNFGDYFRENIDVVNYVEANESWKSNLNRKDTQKPTRSFYLNTDYEVDSLTTLSLNYHLSHSPNVYGLYDVPTYIYENGGNQPVSNYRTLNDHYSKYFSQSLSTQLDKKWNKNNKFSWRNHWINNRKNAFSDIETFLNFKNQPASTNHFSTDDDARINLYSTQVDFEFKPNALTIETGSKYSFVHTNALLDFQETQGKTLVHHPQKSNDFDYKEHNFAAYLSAQYEWQSWQLKAGLRTEYTGLKGVAQPRNATNQQHYWKWFPTLYIQYTSPTKHQLGFSYSKRISRPSYQYLNPAKSYFNLFSYFQGDPNLKPTISHHFNLNYTYKNWNIEGFYYKNISPSMEISYQNPATKMMIYHYTNLEKDQAFGMEFNKTFHPTSFWDISVYSSGIYNENYFLGLDQKIYLNHLLSIRTQISSTFTLDKTSDWQLELGHMYSSGMIQGNMTASASHNIYLATNRKFFDKKLEVSLYVNDLFRTDKATFRTKYANQDNYFIDYQDTQSLSLKLTHRFGNHKLKSTKTIKDIEEKNRM
ncbi:outer membrane beta-barrel family protein [Riemerella columbina]|uniref:outer membrane beta-barrel family protein n=1 Tax=Riemerella columbina TaxID=103810 RepID=UPI000365211E|nr:outer membrane beta-barrel family protein [Riemerella columbina]